MKKIYRVEFSDYIYVDGFRKMSLPINAGSMSEAETRGLELIAQSEIPNSKRSIISSDGSLDLDSFSAEVEETYIIRIELIISKVY